MEFSIDFSTVRQIAANEYAQARTDIAQRGVVGALQQSLQRQDDRLARAGDARTLACKAGCAWCCYFSVDVRAVEVLNILEFVERQFSPEEKQRVRNEIEANSALLKNLSEEERARRNIKCPFLVSNRCSIYAARPQTCRNYHATNAAGCQKSFEEPDNLDIDPDFAPLVYQAGSAHVDAFSRAMRDAGYDIAAYEFNTALAAASADPSSAHQRFATKQRPFAGLQGSEVPPEFFEANDNG